MAIGLTGGSRSIMRSFARRLWQARHFRSSARVHTLFACLAMKATHIGAGSRTASTSLPTWYPFEGMTMLYLIAAAAGFALMTLGGGFYEVLVVDPAWPRRPDLIQPVRGGISRRRFWI